MDKELFMKIEENLYGYFKDRNKITSVRKEIITVSNLINTLEINIFTTYDFWVNQSVIAGSPNISSFFFL